VQAVVAERPAAFPERAMMAVGRRSQTEKRAELRWRGGQRVDFS